MTQSVVENKSFITHGEEEVHTEDGQDICVFPMSFAQRRLWLIDQLNPGTSAYNIIAAVRLSGQFDTAILHQSINEVVQRHEILRTIFTTLDDEPIQAVLPEMVIELSTIQLDSLTKQECDAAIEYYVHQEAQHAFDLSNGPLLRTMVLTLEAKDHILLLNIHHIVADAWSMGVLVREIALLYNGHRTGESADLPPLSIQYADFAIWQQEWLKDTIQDQQLLYWKNQLRDIPLLELPTDRARPPVLTNRGARIPLVLSKPLTRALHALSQQAETTLFMTSLATFQILLARYTGQTDIVVGTPIANRNQAEIEDVIGFFVNTLVLRADLGDNPRFRQLLRQIGDVTLSAYAHQDLPFDQLVEALQPERDMSRTPLFQVMFVLQNAPMPTIDLDDITLQPLDLDIGVAKFDLTLILEERPEGLHGWFEYNTDLFDSTTIIRLSRHWQTLLDQVVINPEQHIFDIKPMRPTEQQHLLTALRGQPRTIGKVDSVHGLVAAQAKSCPDALALIDSTSQLTYEELDQQANQLAHYLRHQGVGPEVRVGICMDRSPLFVIGILGVLKAGGAYVPLDPAHPSERLAFMLTDAQVPLVLTQADLQAHMPPELPTCCLDTDWVQRIAIHSTEAPEEPISLQNLAYVIYTSGSTGQPKGVQISHQALLHLITWHQHAFAITAQDRATLLAGLGFDAAVWEIWPYLTAGASITIPPDAIRADPVHLRDWLTTYDVNIGFVPTPVAEALIQLDWPVDSALRILLTGGDYLHHAPDHQLPFTLVNNYGPTEYTVVTTSGTVSSTPTQQPPSIGCPISNTQVYVLDPWEQIAPIGVPGELTISGTGLSRGYLHRPGLTAERFVPDPWNSTPGACLYRTGDRVRLLSNGEIEFLGRLDHQIKLRGFRIELGEIENALRQHRSVRDAVVCLYETIPGQPHLVAYLVIDSAQAESPSPDEDTGELAQPLDQDIRQFLQNSLPTYMIPSALMVIDTLPLTPNGKVDRRALPAPEYLSAHHDEAMAPRTSLESELVTIWQTVLGIPVVGIQDNFFTLGGHSLLATQVVTQIRKQLQAEIPLRMLFEAPTIVELAVRIDQTHQDTIRRIPPIQTADRTEPIPLSFAQQRLWIIDQLEPNSTAYVIPTALHVRGHLDRMALEQSFNAVIQRHEILRTTFDVIDGQPVQVIDAIPPAPMEYQDLRMLVGNAQTSHVQDLIAHRIRQPFQFMNNPLFHMHLFQLTDEEHILLVVMHHAISDGWSVGVLIQDIATYYEAYVTHQPVNMAVLPIQYVDFAVWQKAWFATDVLDQQIVYWEQQLRDAQTIIDLSTDWPRPPLQTYRGAVEAFTVAPTLIHALHQFNQEEGTTLFMSLLANFKTLLHRYTDQADLLVGTPIANRPLAELEELIGFFVNTLVLRSDMTGRPTFRELLQRIRTTTLDAYAHQDVPFEQLVELLQPERDMSRTPLFQVMFVLQNAPMPQINVANIELTPLDLDGDIAQFDLTLTLEERNDGLYGWFEYNTDLFETTTILRMIIHWQNLLEALVAQPDQHISDTVLLSPDERHHILVEWNPVVPPPTVAHYVHQSFEKQVAQVPDALVLLFEGTRITYGELNQRANQFAHYLHSKGVRSEQPVGVALERSPEAIVALLAVLKAGGVYLPIDPAAPSERLAFMLSDADVSVLITQQSFADRFSQMDQTCVLTIDGEQRAIEQQSTENIHQQIAPDQAAYIIYTSGSTGMPKGVVVSHHAIAAHCDIIVQQYDLTADDRVLQFAAFTFDAALEQILPVLIARATIVLRGSDIWTLADFQYRLIEHQLTVVDIAPTYWHQWLLESAANDTMAFPDSLRLVIVGGEAMSVEGYRVWQQSPFQHIRLLNAYGPTETTITALAYDTADNGHHQVQTSVPIGRPLPHRTSYVLDSYGQPTPVGVPGELVIGGTGLARGYLHRPDSTAERFMPNPFSTRAGERLYRTGDRVRWRSDGTIEFLGRIDQQVKLRGFRIELGEIETVLSQHPDIHEAVVCVRDDVATQPQLVAYVVANLHEQVTDTSFHNTIQSYLQDYLPSYMIPTALVPLETLPITAHGKIDRRALPAPVVSAQRHMAPRTPVEAILVTIWQDVLGVAEIGIQDNFFTLGGHSLLATQVISRIREHFQAELPLRALFEAPTIASLATILDTDDGIIQTDKPAITHIDRDGVVPLSFAQERLWLLDQLQPGNPAYNISVAIRITGKLDVAALRQSFTTLVQRHEVLRTTITAIDGHPSPTIEDEATIALMTTDLGTVPEKEYQVIVDQLAADEAVTSFDLAQGPLLRLHLVRLQNEEHVLLITMHHIISDGWSMGVFVKELTHLYAAAIAGQPGQLLPLPIQYADFAHWQRQWLQGAALETQLAYWRAHLADLDVLDLPTDHVRPAALSAQGAAEHVVLPTTLVKSLQTLSQQADSTLFMTLLAAFQILLMRYSGQEDIAVGSPIAGRNHAEIEGLIGFFINTLVLRTDLDGNPTFRETLQRVRDVTLGAYAHQDVPFERLVEELQPDRHLSRNPLVQVLLVLQNTPLDPITFPELTFAPLPVEITTAKFDLTLTFEETTAGLQTTLVYHTDLFTKATMQRFLSHLQTLLEVVCADPDQQIATLPLLNATEQHQLLVDGNTTTTFLGDADCFHRVFGKQAIATPSAPAVQYEDTVLSYDDLHRRTNQLAHFLRNRGVDTNVPVALYVERSLDFIIGMLGIMKAGGAYVPIDTRTPIERITVILDTIQTPVMITQQHLAEPFKDKVRNTLCLDSLQDVLVQFSPLVPVDLTHPNDIAYVLFTSGSTGTPKGVAVEHRQVMNYTRAILRHLDLPRLSHYALISTPAADLGNTMLFAALCNASCLHIIDQDRTMDPQALLAYAHRYPIDCLKIVPSHLQALLSASNPAAILPRQRLILGGEALSWDLVKQVQALAPTCRIFNHYGPTETTVGVITNAIDTTMCEQPLTATVPLGYPIANTHSYILDPYGQLTLTGVPGELYIGGANTTRGYLHRPDLTAERFVPDALSGKIGERLYRTGDVVRYLPDGQLEFLGRIDHQIKLRGFRIELGEIEAVLTQHPAIRSAVVRICEDQTGIPRLVAYAVATASEGTIIETDIQGFVQRYLPDYMIPTAFVVLDELPLTPNGKIDRRALPVPDAISIHTTDSSDLPSTLTETLLADIWVQLLQVNTPGRYTDFFAAGGNSLLATQVIARIRSVFQVELPLRRLFEDSTLAGLAASVEQAQQEQSSYQLPPLLPAPRTATVPLSFAQQRLWLLDQIEPESSAYAIPVALEICGQLDVTALQQSLDMVVQRHDILRTTFDLVDGTPVQIIHKPASLPIQYIDLQGLNQADQTSITPFLLTRATEQPFNLTHGPLIRAMIVQKAQDEYTFLIVMHHIISDGWSIGILVQEIEALYPAYVAGAAPVLHDLPIQYADFAIWQRDWLTGPILAQQLAYWQQQLANAPVLLELPTDRPRPHTQTFAGASQLLALPLPLKEALITLSHREHATLFMTLLTAWQTLLARYARQDDVCVGTPIAGRTHNEIEPLIGFFVNTLVLRTTLTDQPTFQALLQRVRQTTLEAYAHQHVPFERLVEELQPQRSLSYSPLFQVMFALQNAPIPDLMLPDVTVQQAMVDSATAKFDITFALWETPQGLAGGIEYNTDLFDSTTITRMVDHFETLLTAIVDNPAEPVHNFCLLTQQEQQQLLFEWNMPAIPAASETTLYDLISAQMAKTPTAIALTHRTDQLTYQRLEQQVNALAAYLQTQGVGPEVLVGVCLERSSDLVIALLAILKAGGAYVPLDPNYPTQRLDFIVADTQAPVLITTTTLNDRLPNYEGQRVCLDTLSIDPAQHPFTSITIHDSNLAYLIYTSGSTGRPKGVAITHQNAIALLKWAHAVFTPAELAGVLATTSVCFDLSVFELFTPLSCGGSVILAESMLQLPTLVSPQPITLINTVPSVLTEIVHNHPLPESVQTVNLAGEPLPLALVNRLYQFDHIERVVNLYGPSEDTTYSTIAETAADEYVLIGRSIDHTQSYVLDVNQQPVPIGVIGELYLGGLGLARGYLNRADITAERFVPDPFSITAGSRMYRTGDLVRYLVDGQIDYLGRIDHQVKVRGFRIELGEIETMLGSHAAIQEVAVLVQKAPSGEDRLIAYLVYSGDDQPATSDFREYVRSHLPDYMVPSAFVALETLPQMPNGKIDRQALLTMEASHDHITRTPVAPRTSVELQLTHIWEEVLGIPSIGVQDNFFELGGHSLIAVRMMAHIQEHFGRTVPLMELFRGGTIEHLALLLAQQTIDTPSSPLVPLQPHGDSTPLFLLHPSGGDVLCYVDLIRHLGQEQPIYAFRAPGIDDEQQPYDQMEAMASYYIELLQGVQPEGPYRLGGWSSGGVVAFEMAQQLIRSGHTIDLLAIIDSSITPSYDEPDDDIAQLVEVATSYNLSVSVDDLRPLDPETQLRYVLDLAKAANMLPPTTEVAQIRRYLEVFKANIHALDTYKPQPYPYQITFFQSCEKVIADREESLPKWQQLTDKPVEVYNIPGHHHTMMGEPHVQILAHHLTTCLQS